MKETRIEFRLTHKEKRELDRLSKKYDYSLSEYIRRKIFTENCDYDEYNERYISPALEKNNLINITVNYKALYLLSKILARLGMDSEELEAEALEYARVERLKYGYRAVKS